VIGQNVLLPPAMERRVVWLAITLTGALALLVIGNVAIGSVPLPIGDVLRAVSGDTSSGAALIIWELRLPRVIAGVLAGAALGMAGLMMQTLFQNPLADPWALGVTAGAQFGVAMVVTAGAIVGIDVLATLGTLNQLGVIAGAVLGSSVVMLLVAAAARRVSAVTLLVLGLMIGYLAQGLVSVVLHFTTRTQGRMFDAWNDGTFANVTWDHLQLFAPAILAGALLAGWLRKPLNALLLGERYAASLGLTIAATRRLVLASTLLLAAPVTAYCGPLAFLGLIAPHLARAATRTSDHRTLLPMAALIGATIAVAGDLIVNLPWERHFLHLNAINGLIGAPIVIWLLMRRRQLMVGHG